MADRTHPDEDFGPIVSLVVPCFNEESILQATAPPLLNELSQTVSNCEVILVDNGSTDGTRKVIDRILSTDHRYGFASVEVNRGYGLGVLTGYQAAQGVILGHIPADGPVLARDVARLAGMAIEAGEGTLVSAVRHDRQETALRRAVSASYNTLFTWLFGSLGPDINGTPKFLHRNDLESLKLTSTDYFLEPEMMIKSRRAGLKIKSVPVESQRRPGGESKVSARLIGACLEFLRNMLRYRFTAR